MKQVFARLAGVGILASALVVGACRTGGDSDSLPTATSPATGMTASPTREASPAASPTSLETASPAASPASVTPVTLADAYANLHDQGSYRMTMTLTGFSATEALPGNGANSVGIVLEQADSNRHVVVEDSSGTQLVELWRVDDEYYADIGAGPTRTTEDDPLLGRLVQFLEAPEAFLDTMSGDGARYRVTGTETVNETDTVVEKATYEVDGASRSILITEDRARVDSTLWVAQDERYLVRLVMMVQAVDSATPAATPATGAGPATATADVTDVGEVPPIEAPTK